MFSYLPTITLAVLFILSPAVGQESNDTTAVEEEGSGREMFTSVDVSYSQDKGNTDFLSLYYGLDYTLIGDAGPLKDTEFLFSFNRSDDKFDGEPFTDDQYLTLKFDIWANQRFSPFLFFQKSFDNVIGLEDRVNFGLGGKVEVFGPFSVSYAMLWETEHYLNSTTMDYASALVDWYNYTDSTWWGEYDYVLTEFPDSLQDYYDWIPIDTTIDGVDYVYTDSSLVYADYYYTDSVFVGQEWMYTDSTEFETGGKSDPFFRHSIRPKFKIKLFDDNLVFDYRFYY